MSWDRHERHEAILKEKIAVIVLERLADPRLGFVTITDVELSRDKRHANVSYTCFGTEAQRRTTARALKDGAPRVQELLAPSLTMRLIPQLRFVHDDGVAKESKLLKLIEGVTEERLERTGPDDELDPEGLNVDGEDERVRSLPVEDGEAASWRSASGSLAEREAQDAEADGTTDDLAGDDGAAEADHGSASDAGPDTDEPRQSP